MVDHTSHEIRRAGDWSGAIASCVLTYEERFLRRKVIQTQAGEALLVNLAQTTSLHHGDACLLTNGCLIEIIAAREPLYAVTGDLVQLAWHIGNRHTPCQIEQDRLMILRDSVIGHMLEHLGARVQEVTEQFTPEGGAYGYGRTHSHDHGHTAHEH